MRGTRFVLVVGLLVAAFALAGCGGDDDEGTATDTDTVTETTDATDTTGEAGGTLIGTVGTADDPDAFEITLTTEDGTPVTTLTAGDYTIDVSDQSDIHNFHLTGPGVDESTDVAGTEDATWDVTVEDGTYTYVCDPHASTMTGSFDVTG